jgi:hypothetical protein
MKTIDAVYKSPITGCETLIKISGSYSFERTTYKNNKPDKKETVTVCISASGVYYESTELIFK